MSGKWRPLTLSVMGGSFATGRCRRKYSFRTIAIFANNNHCLNFEALAGYAHFAEDRWRNEVKQPRLIERTLLTAVVSKLQGSRSP
jgi:hypothetical protein